MRKHRKANVTEVVEEAPHEGADQAGGIEQRLTDESESAESAGTEIQKVDSVTEAVQEAEGAEETGHIAETSSLAQRFADEIGCVFGISGEEAHKTAQRSSENLNAIIQSSSVLAEVTQSISREWLQFTRECMEQNFKQFESLLRCRTPQDITAVQSEIVRDNLERFLQFGRRIAKISMQVRDAANKRAAETVERAQAA